MVASLAIGDAIAVANVEAGLTAVAPDRQLNEPRKGSWKTWIKAARVDVFGKASKKIGTIARPITGRAIRMSNAALLQNTRAMQEVVHK